MCFYIRSAADIARGLDSLSPEVNRAPSPSSRLTGENKQCLDIQFALTVLLHPVYLGIIYDYLDYLLVSQWKRWTLRDVGIIRRSSLCGLG